MKKAMFYEKKGDSVVCRLCAHSCVIKPENTGRCGVRKNVKGELYSMNYGLLSAINIDPVEKKPLRHFMPGTRTLSIGSYGCNFSCLYCQNYQIAHEIPGYLVQKTPKDIVDMAIDMGYPSISYTYNEPTVFYEFMLETAKLAREMGLKNIMVTNGFMQEEPLRLILEYMDAMNIDLKTFRDETYRAICGGRLEPVKNNIKIAAQKCHVEVTVLIVTGMNDNEQELTELFEWLSGVDKAMPLHITRYFPSYKYNEPATDISFMEKMEKKAKEYLDRVYLGNIW